MFQKIILVRYRRTALTAQLCTAAKLLLKRLEQEYQNFSYARHYLQDAKLPKEILQIVNSFARPPLLTEMFDASGKTPLQYANITTLRGNYAAEFDLAPAQNLHLVLQEFCNKWGMLSRI